MAQPLTLIVMAAGMGRRYGGLKQIEPVGPSGETLLDYAIYDALRAGFNRIVFVVRKGVEDFLRGNIEYKVGERAGIAYVYQELTRIPAGFTIPANRQKPWGTGHAVLCCQEVVQTPFVVINADDYYGATAFQMAGQFLLEPRSDRALEASAGVDFCMGGYLLCNTLSAFGQVARGICQVTAEGYLELIHERTGIEAHADGVKYTENGNKWVLLPPDTIVSMNFWGFTPSVFDELELYFRSFLTEKWDALESAEFYLPEAIGEMVCAGKARVRVLPIQERWFGITHPQDRLEVKAAMQELIRQGVYPENLWSGEG